MLRRLARAAAIAAVCSALCAISTPAVAQHEHHGVPAGSAQVVRAAEAVKLRIRESKSAVSTLPESSDELHDLKIGKTHLVWSGHATGDSTRIEEPIQESWRVRGTSGTSWNVLLILRPIWSRPLVGVLRVDGKDDLAKSLKSSPIRFLGPRYLGGSADLIFSR
jgi:hypothetical protein